MLCLRPCCSGPPKLGLLPDESNPPPLSPFGFWKRCLIPWGTLGRFFVSSSFGPPLHRICFFGAFGQDFSACPPGSQVALVDFQDAVFFLPFLVTPPPLFLFFCSTFFCNLIQGVSGFFFFFSRWTFPLLVWTGLDALFFFY